MSEFCELIFVLHTNNSAIKSAYGSPKTGIMPHSIEYHSSCKFDVDYDCSKFSVIPKYHWPIYKGNRPIGVIYKHDAKKDSIAMLQISFNGRTINTIFDKGNSVLDEIISALIKYDKNTRIEMFIAGKSNNIYTFVLPGTPFLVKKSMFLTPHSSGLEKISITSSL